ncbi:MAG: fused MFS/spermidine synthase [Terriglobia bacterium]
MSSKFIYVLVIFSSAFLLFQVQPLLGKIILPWFGGSAGLWIVCLLFFQFVLLLGYLYAHLLTRRFRARTQTRIHAALLCASLLVLPILPKDSWRPSTPFDPALHILLLLGATVGLPYFLLSATSPLLQAWYARKDADAAPYRLYAVSNIGSLLALVSYPVLMEPWVGTSHQALGWSWSYAAVALLCAVVALSSVPKDTTGVRAEAPPPPDWKAHTLWISLAACGSAFLLAISHHISQNVASVPLLWVIPLALYLLTFILCFEGRAWYRRDLFLRLLGVALGSMAYAVAPSFAGLPLAVSIPLYCCCLFVCCMFCHGELARIKPHAAYLTSFYLMCSFGGVIGALFVAVVAPRLFSGDYELRTVIGSCALLALAVLHRDPGSPFYKARSQPAWLLTVGLALAIMVSLGVTAREEAKGTRLMERNFYGVLRVVDQVAPNVVLVKGGATQTSDENFRFEKLMNGTIDHGLQFLSPARRDLPTTYYGPTSGIGITLKAAGATTPLDVGVVGLGAGTLAAYGRRGDRFEFYEINPMVVQIANSEFSFLRDSEAKVDIVMGDGRLSLEHQPPQGFDVVAVDAFSGDSIPVHLLTREAFELYFRHLNPKGVLAVHISNQYLNLAPVVAGAANWLGKEAVVVENKADSPRGIYRATWVLVGNRQGFIGQAEIEKAGTVLGAGSSQLQWTDDYSSLFKVLM